MKMLSALMILCALLPGAASAQWGAGGCGPVGPLAFSIPQEQQFAWRLHDSQPGCYALFYGQQQVGFYNPSTGIYHRWLGGSEWREEESPIPLPIAPSGNKKMPLPERQPGEPKTGVLDEKLHPPAHGVRFSFRDQVITEQQANNLIGNVPDFLSKLRIVMVASEMERQTALPQILAMAGNDCIVQGYNPDEWQATGAGYKPGLWIVKPQPGTSFGQPLWYQDSLDLDKARQGLESVRQPQPIDPNKIPGPKPKPLLTEGINLEALMIGGIVLLVIGGLMSPTSKGE